MALALPSWIWIWMAEYYFTFWESATSQSDLSWFLDLQGFAAASANWCLLGRKWCGLLYFFNIPYQPALNLAENLFTESHTFLPNLTYPRWFSTTSVHVLVHVCAHVCGHSQWWRGVLDRRKIAHVNLLSILNLFTF